MTTVIRKDQKERARSDFERLIKAANRQSFSAKSRLKFAVKALRLRVVERNYLHGYLGDAERAYKQALEEL